MRRIGGGGVTRSALWVYSRYFVNIARIRRRRERTVTGGLPSTHSPEMHGNVPDILPDPPPAQTPTRAKVLLSPRAITSAFYLARTLTITQHCRTHIFPSNCDRRGGPPWWKVKSSEVQKSSTRSPWRSARRDASLGTPAQTSARSNTRVVSTTSKR